MTEDSRRQARRSGPWWYAPKRWMYRGGRPRALARAMNSLSSWMYDRGWMTLGRAATLIVVGRRSGEPISVPVVVTDFEGSRYLVSMLGNEANWVRNVRASGGEATLGAQPVRLVEIPIDERAPILRLYLQLAPGARPHIPVSRAAPLSEFRSVAESYPVFRIEQPVDGHKR